MKKLKAKMIHLVLSLFRTITLHARITFLLVVTFLYICIISVYFLFGTPPWVNQINFSKNQLFMLEMLALTFVLLTFFVVEYSKIIRGDSEFILNKFDWYTLIFFIVVTSGYSSKKIMVDHDPLNIRLIYTIFCFCLLTLWFHNARLLTFKTIKNFITILIEINRVPHKVFSSGRQISSLINSFSWAVTILTIPLFCWIPTLLGGGNLINPRNIALALGLIVFSLSFVLPLFSQQQISKSLILSFKMFDENIANEIMKNPTKKEDYERLKSLLELRTNLSNSVKGTVLEMTKVMIQYSGMITAIISLSQLGKSQ